jgi:hypothetical protein
VNRSQALEKTIVWPAVLVVTMITGPAEANPITFSFNGGGTSGNVVFDDSVFDSNPHPLKGLYLGAIQSFVVNINGTHQTETDVPVFETIQGSSGSVAVGLADNGIGSCGPTVDCLAFFLGSVALPPADPSKFDLTFYYAAGSLSSDALPVAIPATGEAILRSDARQFFLGRDASGVISPSQVPEPATWSLLGIGTAILAFFRSGSRASGRRSGRIRSRAERAEWRRALDQRDNRSITR